MSGQPYDYSSLLRGGQQLVPDYAEETLRRQLGSLQTQQFGLQNQRAHMEMDALRSAATKQSAFDAEVAEISADPTPQKISGLMLKYPEFADKAKSAWTVRDSALQQADLRDTGEVYAAVRAGKVDLAITVVRRRIEADKAADGIADPADEEMLADLESGDPTRLKSAELRAGIQLATAVGTEKFGLTYGTIKEGDQDYTLGNRRYDGATNQVIAEAPYAPRMIAVQQADGSISYTEYQPGGGGQSSGGSVASALQTNPGAIKDSPFARAQPGYAGSSGGFATFATPEQGKAAQAVLLRDNYLAKGFDTPRKVIERYAPRGPENSDASVNNYIGYVSRRLGIGPNDTITPAQGAQLAQAIREFETGQTQGGGGGTSVIARGAAKAKPPSETRSLNGKVYVKIDGRWYAQGGQ